MIARTFSIGFNTETKVMQEPKYEVTPKVAYLIRADLYQAPPPSDPRHEFSNAFRAAIRKDDRKGGRALRRLKNRLNGVLKVGPAGTVYSKHTDDILRDFIDETKGARRYEYQWTKIPRKERGRLSKLVSKRLNAPRR
jgi:hypothetical protein